MNNKNIYSQRTWLLRNIGEIKITASSSFDPINSDVINNVFTWHYNITIDNFTPNNLRLIAGRWDVFDKYGKNELQDDVLSTSLIVINKGQSFECKNIVKLFSESGLIQGQYSFINLQSNQKIFVNIPTISLDRIIKEQQWN